MLGPQKAVTVADIPTVLAMQRNRARFIDVPMLWAYFSPSSKAFSALTDSNATANPDSATATSARI
jgi:hypothetical protein